MRISGIDFPESLLGALRDGRLVVFAGAGVSRGEPACLPDFKALAEAVALHTSQKLREEEPEDRFLGRLHDQGKRVHEITAQALVKDDPQPTRLHLDVLRLYQGHQSVRLVTTNFDMLFEKGAEEVFNSKPEIFRAPALPLGSKFNGIVHVHGVVDRADDMVLTDKDFGRAYLTEGWARRFILDLFSSYTVLFVGYSHSEVVMTYLARALPPAGNQRFALAPNRDGDSWQALGIKPIVYPSSSRDDHQALYESMSGLANHVSRGALGWQRQITEIASAPPSLDKEDMDLISDSMSDRMRVRFFTDAASDPRWIGWLDRHNYLNTLFQAGEPSGLSNRDRQLAWWLAHKFAVHHSNELFLLITQNGLKVHPDFWLALGATIGRESSCSLDATVLVRWVSMLLDSAPPLQQFSPRFPYLDVLPKLVERCIEQGETDTLLDIFDAMATTALELRPGIVMPEYNVDLPLTAESSPVYDYLDLHRIWNAGLKPKLDQVVEPLMSSVVQILVKQYRTLHSWQAADREWDPTSFRRHAIKPHEQDGYPESVDALIDVARDCLEHLTAERHRVAVNWFIRLVREDAPILRRLAVNALPARDDLTADGKIDWLLTEMGLHDIPVHHETFQAMRALYPDASPDRRRAVLKEIQAYVWPVQEDDERAILAARRHFNWLHWLQEADPKCNLVRQSLAAAREQYPDFKPAEYPDLTHYTADSGFVAPQSHRSVDELLSRPASELVKELLSFCGKNPRGPDRGALLSVVEEAATRRFEWGLDLANAMAKLNTWDTDLWPCLMRAWSRELDEANHRRVLGYLANQQLYPKHARPIADALRAPVRDGGLAYSAVLLSELNQLANALWKQLDRDDPISEEGNRLLEALQHPAGVLSQFWLESLSLWLQQQDARPDKLTDEYLQVFSAIVQDPTQVGRLGKSVLATQLGFMSTADENWTAQNLIHLFEDTEGPDYQAVWHGFLYGGPIRPQVASMLEDAVLQAMRHLDSLFPTGGDLRRQFIRVCTAMAAYYVENPLDCWVPTLFQNTDAEDRCHFAWDVELILADMVDEEQQEWWQRWLKEYWEKRLQGIPTSLREGEVTAMLGWLPNFSNLFPKAVHYAVQMPTAPFEGNSVVREVGNGELWRKHPRATAALLIYLAEAESPVWAWHGGRELIEKLLTLDLPEDLNMELKEIPARLGL